MCVIIVKPAGVTVSDKVLKQCFDRNDDGAGFAFSTPEGIEIKKGFFKVKHLQKALKDFMDRELVIHFRIKSHGKICYKNCHPFFVQSSLSPQYTFAIAHNGMLPWTSTETDSDTVCFIRDILKPQLDRDPYFFDFLPGRVLVERMIGDRNKFAIMRHNKETNETTTYILNKKQGTEEDGCWFSNMNHKPTVSQYQLAGSYQSGRQWSEEDERFLMGYRLDNGIWIPPEKKNVPETSMDRLIREAGGPIEQPSKSPISGTGPEGPIDEGEEWRMYLAENNKANEASASKTDNVIKLEHIEPDDVDGFNPGAESSVSAMKLEHLSKDQKKELRRQAADYIRSCAQVSTKGWTPAEMIIFYRAEIRSQFQEQTKGMTHTQLDVWLVNGGLDEVEDEPVVLGSN